MSSETKVIAGIGIATVIIVVVGALFMGGKSSPDKPVPPADANVLVRPDSNRTASKSAKVTLVEFGDYQCPACGASHPIVEQLLKEYEGKVNFVFRNYPLPMHPNAMIAAVAAEASGSQGKYFEMHRELFGNQSEWAESKNPMEHFTNYADSIGLDTVKFIKDVEDKKFEDKIKKDITDGNSVGVNATPTFFINGQKQSGGLPYDQFKIKLDEALNTK